MISRLASHINYFSVLGALTIVSIFAAILSEEYLLAGLPLVFILGFQTLVDFRKVYFILLACIPISTEFNFTPSLGTDLPTEPLIVGLTLTYILYFFKNPNRLRVSVFRHPIIIALSLHLAWTFVTMVFSELFLVSMKFFLAKMWYVITFVFLTVDIIRTEKDFKNLYWIIYIPLFIVVCITLVRQYMLDFSFYDIQESMDPFFRNHVTYAALLALFTPYLWFARLWSPRGSRIWWFLLVSLPIMLAAIQFSYTRAAYVAIFMAIGAYYIIKFKLVKYVLALSLVGAIVGVMWVIEDNNYLVFAPNYETTVRQENFGNLVEATYELEDISTMERVYRWVAGFKMANEDLVFGFGPGNFYNFYKGYTVNRFRTYVSDNPEKSGVHNYFLMVLIEQGILGVLIFIGLVFFILIKGEIIYHQSKTKLRKNIVMTAMLSMVIIYAFLLINDMVETDKVGSFFFINMAILINMDLLNKKDNNESLTTS